MLFRTKVDIPRSKFVISHQESVFSIGSCFATNIGARLSDAKFSICNNPFGVLYNPQSIARSLELLLKDSDFDPKYLFEHDGMWHSWMHHSSFSEINKDVCEERIKESIKISRSKLINSDYLIVTLGTSWVFRHKGLQEIVSNCHKIPGGEFERYRMTVEEVVGVIKPVLDKLVEINPKIQIIFTISPIRHWKDGAHENQVSKSVLFVALEKILSKYANTTYFPAYEIMMDELRDYRFYADDMIHPNQIAIDYIWQRFIETYCDAKTIAAIQKIENLNKAINHRPFNPKTEAFKKHVSATIDKCIALEKEIGVDYKNEINGLREFL